MRFLASDGLRISNFLRDTGLEPQQLGALVGSRDFLGAVLDFVVRDESLLMVFAAEAGHRPELVMGAHRLLQGPEPETSL